ncbi:hypothetical protein FRB93_006782 [Tulasnella sp. JGI-2019a]|nr:hypothetical protein FRB93_006782 [Tulasnella sp. JGI-2019a]
MMASIVLLAPELILNISRYLSVTDAVLFMSCIWSRYDIPPSTFDLLTASTLEPQRTVARPYRFQHSITKKNLARRSLIKLQRPYTRTPAEKNFAMIAHHVLQTEEDIYSSIAVTPDPTGLGPMIFVQILHDVDPTNKFSVVAYRINPASNALERVASLDKLDRPTNIGPLRVTGSLLAHTYIKHAEQKLFVWNWVNSRYGVYQSRIISLPRIQP